MWVCVALRSCNGITPSSFSQFKGSGARAQFDSMDRLVEYINSNQQDPQVKGVRIRYSTPSAYFDAVRAESTGQADHDAAFRGANSSSVAPVGGGAVIPFPVYRPPTAIDGGVDFFPYADNSNSWWTGKLKLSRRAHSHSSVWRPHSRAQYAKIMVHPSLTYRVLHISPSAQARDPAHRCNAARSRVPDGPGSTLGRRLARRLERVDHGAGSGSSERRRHCRCR